MSNQNMIDRDTIGALRKQEEKGLFHKYNITKSDGTPVDSSACYFVLRLDTDPAARLAVRAYAYEVEKENPELAMGLRNVINKIEEQIEEQEKRKAHESKT